MSFGKDIKLVVKPYYFINILLSLSYIIVKKIPGICNYLFKEEQREFGSREIEILFFLAIIVMIRSRKTGSTTMITYLKQSFLYNKGANLILFFMADFMYGVIFLVLFVVMAMLLPEPTYKGQEYVTYFRNAQSFEEELAREKRVVWIVCFYTNWNPSCVNFASIFSQLSFEYHLENLRFGKIDVGRFPDSAAKYNINDGSLSRQLPTVILFKDGKEVDRRPSYDAGRLSKFYFSFDNVVACLGLNNLYKECKENPIRKQKQSEKMGLEDIKKTKLEKKTD